MRTIAWKDRFSVGVPQLDDQHRTLAELINRVVALAEAPVRSPQIEDALNAVMEYAGRHFATEEAFLETVAYPGLEDHRGQHGDFTERAAELCMATINGDAEVPRDLADFLVEWWHDHILVEDMAYRSFLARQRHQH